MSVSPKSGLPVARILAAALLASVVTGCSSDATRFSSIFTNDDSLVTNSVQKRQITGLDNGAPIPGAEVARSGVVQPDYSNRQQALNQPYPGSTSPAGASSARMAAAPIRVERNDLSAPQPSNGADRNVALAQPFPTARTNAPRVNPDMVTTGSTANSSGTRLGATAPQRVTLARGESIATLSRRYGISEQEILKANGMPNAASAIIGQEIIIPGQALQNNAARASAGDVRLQDQGNVPVPKRSPEQRVAVLPGASQLRDKSQQTATPNSKAITGQGKPQPDGAATYEVKPGDSLSKVARTTGVSIDALKAANGLTSGGIRIGQKLKLPTASAADNATLKTASVPQADKTEAKTQPVAAYKPPVATQTVTEVSAIADPKEVAPEATGIGKYRWPVRGAVVAGYGANVDGKRNDGIDISVPSGTPIKAAENGVVIYAGNGLKELGNTVLVRHDDGTVTVYGHADALSVSRGQKVQRGQTVATSGMSGNIKRPMLHFEVRKNATPVNPMTFLE